MFKCLTREDILDILFNFTIILRCCKKSDIVAYDLFP